MNYFYHYGKLIEKRKLKVPEGYTEKHHILPKTQGGLDIPENKVQLKAKEHLLAHLLLVKIYPEHYGLLYAANWMSNNKKYGCRKYAWLKEKFSAMQTGKPLSEEHRKKIPIATPKIKSTKINGKI